MLPWVDVKWANFKGFLVHEVASSSCYEKLRGFWFNQVCWILYYILAIMRSLRITGKRWGIFVRDDYYCSCERIKSKFLVKGKFQWIRLTTFCSNINENLFIYINYLLKLKTITHIHKYTL